jgi:hypothetical protein
MECWAGLMHDLGPRMAKRASVCDDDDKFVPDAAVVLRRPTGKWSLPFHVNPSMIALPLV